MHFFRFFRDPSACGIALALTLLFAPARTSAASVTPPELIQQTPPDWPGTPEARDVEVPVIVTVQADGSVSEVAITESAGASYDAAAVRSALSWRFSPALRDGVAVAARVRGLVRFVAKVAEADAPHASSTPARGVDSAPPAKRAVAPSPSAPGGTSAPAEEVVVTGRAPPPSRGASDYHVEIGELSRVPRKNATELLTLAPGVFLTNEGGDGHAERIYLRGFDAREGQDIELSVDGVPVNESGNPHGNGFADLHFIIPELVLALRVLEGPFDPRQGNYAVAGSANYETGLRERGLTAKYSFGSYGTQRALVMWGPPGESIHTYGGAEIARTDGVGQNRDAQRGSAMAQYEGQLGRRASFRVSGTAHANAYHDAGLLREDAVATGRKGFFDTEDFRQGGDGSRYQLATDIESRTGDFLLYQQLFAIARGMRVRENFTGFLLDTQQAVQTPHDQRGDLLDTHVAERTLGARGFARTHAPWRGLEQELELGYFARGDSVTSLQQRVEAASGVPYRTVTDLESELADIGLYADVALRPLRWLTLRGGVRADLFVYDVHDRCAVQSVSAPSPDNPPGDDSCLEQQRGGEHREPDQRSSTASTKLMPRATLLFGPFEHVTFSLAWGEGVRSIDPSYITEDVATPFASITAQEAGVVYAHTFDAAAVVVRSVFFRTHVDKDLVFSETEGRSVLGGGTTRTGWTGALRLTHAFFDQNANVTLVRSAFDESGLLVPYVPDLVVRSDSAVSADLPFDVLGRAPHGSLGLGASYVGRRALPYGQRSDTIFTLDASAGLRYRAVELTLEATNLLDAQYRAAEYDFVSSFPASAGAAPTLVPARHFAAGAPRMLLLSLSLTIGGS